MKHTPGPWVVNDFCTQDGADVAIWTSHDPHTAKSICECHYESHADLMRGETGCNRLEAEANAKLIAAAPELLEWAEKVLAAYMPQFNDSRAVDDVLVGLAAAVSKAS